MQKPQLTIFRVAVKAPWGQVPAPLNSCDLPFLVFIFTILLAPPFIAVNTQTGWFIVEQATVS
ncbi:hypothetical protein K443DRAFT_649409 [Laccaria amethystina LaAM-08-1]|uniref:Uncharacterized protein n=1 Tax=Laccaria amethystina LaAM-08-1 TaxID=1095629 RepID=A0A0C9X7Z0_9AGAR|nr:hypothetical protein K443DRAFT_649409 [Laccaria amethystina LaAM-08-1]